MALQTTVIGAFPKPSYLELPDWFSGDGTEPEAVAGLSPLTMPDALRASADKAVHEVIRLQVDAGVDIPTDGEMRRENYVHYHCRHLDGIDFDRLTPRLTRNGTWQTMVPTVVGPISRRSSFLDRDYLLAQAVTTRRVKATMPGPLTIMDTTANDYYPSDESWGLALAAVLNLEVRSLVQAGCTQIQIDEPVFARYPDAARRYGFELLEVVLEGVPSPVTTTLHICCGYPDRLDNDTYPKADPATYLQLVDRVETSSCEAVSLEDAHRQNPVELFERLATTTLVLGSVNIASSRLEAPDEVVQRAEQVLAVVPEERLVLAPDCGLGLLPRDTAVAKLQALRAAADRL